jgi:hypothetical protein
MYTMKTLLALTAIITLFAVVDASMLGIKIGNNEATLSKLKLKQIAKREGIIKYRTENNNDFVVTIEEGKVVYMENDWNQKTEANVALLPGFTFGQTSLKDIRKRFGNKGFVYAENQNYVTAEYLYEYHCFEIDSPQSEVLVVVTKIPFSTTVTENTDIAQKLKLDAIVLADADYLDFLWGAQKSYDKEYKKVRL